MIGKTDFDLSTQASHDALMAFHQQEQLLIESRKPLMTYEVSIQSDESDQVTHFSISKFPLKTIGGEITGIIGINYDITERKQAEGLLQKYNQRLRIIQQVEKDIIAAQSSKAIATSVLANIRQLIPCSSANLFIIDEPNHELIVYTANNEDLEIKDNSRLPFYADTIFNDLNSGKTSIIHDWRQPEVRPLTDLGKRALEAGICTIMNAPLIIDGQLSGSLNLGARTPYYFTPEHEEIILEVANQVAIAFQQSRLYEQIEQANIELEQRVAERTAQLEAKNHELETFTYTVSHDLKAPLRGIDGYSRLLLSDYMDLLGDEGRSFLQNIRIATDQMNQLIDDLLAYSRLEWLPFQSNMINVKQIVESLVAEHSADILVVGATVTVALPDILVSADSDGLIMALRNLLGNALKFSSQTEQPLISINGRETENSCILWVQDNGIGFDMKYHDRILQMFQRLHRIEQYGGTGIGLAIVNKSMERMGGRVWAESELGKGSTFYLEIPK